MADIAVHVLQIIHGNIPKKHLFPTFRIITQIEYCVYPTNDTVTLSLERNGALGI